MVLFLLGYEDILSYQGQGLCFLRYPRAEDICWHMLGTEQVLAGGTNRCRQFFPMKVTLDIISLDVGPVEQLPIL